ncbi:PIN domain-containing protein [soil metagenome]
MIAPKITLDTNILIYSIDSTESHRHKKALELMQRLLTEDCSLLLQALCEFFHATTRKKIVPIEVAKDQIEDWQQLFPTLYAKPTTVNRALKAVTQHQLQFWDAMLWAAAKESGITLILTEDFQHGRTLEGVKFMNPFITNDYL